ncbi:MAG TPA: SDR family oxidoreductase [Sediminibacterium sp.]|nr:SDR family oxidoreductase [Sediminibacterium sp.]
MQYTLITGASKGIGKCMAQQLAAKKQNLLLVARTASLLEILANQLQQEYGVKVDYLAIDLAGIGAAQTIFGWCQANGYQINTLINNAGYGNGGAFSSISTKQHTDMMQVNMNVPVELISLFLPQLKLLQRAYILNIASSAAYQAVPGLSLYAASKSFVLNFSRGLQFELKDTGITVTTVCPGGTDTDFANRAQLGPKAVKAGEKLNLSPEDVAKLAIDAMYAGKTELITGFLNKLGAALVWLMPKKLVEKTAAGLYGID